jgi:catechol 2,3-dioxygenase-like lactoylglutathione lyase family enzyme
MPGHTGREQSVQCYIEHANVAVLDMDEAIRFLTIAFPHFKVRGGGENTEAGKWKKWCHLGTQTIYVAIEQSSTVDQPRADGDSPAARINHVGFGVDDVVEIKRKVEAAGYVCNALIDESPSRMRLYVDDGSGLTWEFVEYLSDDPAVRNDYSVEARNSHPPRR